MAYAAPDPAAQPLKNPKHEAVLQAWIADPERVWWRAYQSVYPKSNKHAAETGASRLLKGVEFKARHDALLSAIAEKVVAERVMSEREVLEELSKLGRSSIKNCILRGDNTADVVMSIDDLPDEHAATIKTLTVESYTEGAAEEAREVRRVKIELHDKRGPLRDLAQHYGLLTEKHDHNLHGPNGGPVETHQVGALSELELARRIAFALEEGARRAAAAQRTLAGSALPAPAADQPKEPTK